MDQPIFEADFHKFSHLLGTLWLDLSCLTLLGILMGIGMAPFSRKPRDLVGVLGIQIIAAALILASYPQQGTVPFELCLFCILERASLFSS